MPLSSILALASNLDMSKSDTMTPSRRSLHRFQGRPDIRYVLLASLGLGRTYSNRASSKSSLFGARTTNENVAFGRHVQLYYIHANRKGIAFGTLHVAIT